MNDFTTPSGTHLITWCEYYLFIAFEIGAESGPYLWG
jgi:hypothetical protein